MGCVACRVRAGLVMGTEWGTRWRMSGGGKGNGINSVGVWSSMERATSTLGELGMWFCSGAYAIAVGFRAMHEVAT